MKRNRENNGLSNNSMNVMAKQKLCCSACPLNLSLRGGGFAYATSIAGNPET